MREFSYCVGDLVSLRISADELCIFDIDWNDSRYKQFKFKYFEIIAKLQFEYIIEVPVLTADNFDLDKDVITKYNIDKKFLGSYGCLVHHSSIGNRKYHDYYKNPLFCILCKDSYPYAEANFGNKLICWSCRNDPRNKYKLEQYAKYQA
jgi:hypothetical protein